MEVTRVIKSHKKFPLEKLCDFLVRLGGGAVFFASLKKTFHSVRVYNLEPTKLASRLSALRS